jgi:hypothetical protein
VVVVEDPDTGEERTEVVWEYEGGQEAAAAEVPNAAAPPQHQQHPKPQPQPQPQAKPKAASGGAAAKPKGKAVQAAQGQKSVASMFAKK